MVDHVKLRAGRIWEWEVDDPEVRQLIQDYQTMTSDYGYGSKERVDLLCEIIKKIDGPVKDAWGENLDKEMALEYVVGYKH